MGNFDYVGGGELYWNDGSNDTSDKALYGQGSLPVVLERGMVHNKEDGLWYHKSSWGFDQLYKQDFAFYLIDTVCWRVFVMDLQGTSTHYVKMTGDNKGYGGFQLPGRDDIWCFKPKLYCWDQRGYTCP